MLRTLIALLALGPAIALAQSPSAAARPPARDSVAGFEGGDLYVGARTWLGIYGTASVGVHGELARTKQDFGTGRIGLGGGVDFYRYSADYAGLANWSVTVVPVSVYANYHFPLRNRRIDPYAGVGLGYSIVRVSARSFDGSIDGSGTRGSSVFTLGHVGARYFVRPNLAIQAQSGLGLGALSAGVTWKM